MKIKKRKQKIEKDSEKENQIEKKDTVGTLKKNK